MAGNRVKRSPVFRARWVPLALIAFYVVWYSRWLVPATRPTEPAPDLGQTLPANQVIPFRLHLLKNPSFQYRHLHVHRPPPGSLLRSEVLEVAEFPLLANQSLIASPPPPTELTSPNPPQGQPGPTASSPPVPAPTRPGAQAKRKGKPKWQHKALIEHQTTPPSPRFVLYHPTSNGLGDRLRGLVISYYLAQITGRKLAVKNPIHDPDLLSISAEATTPLERLSKDLGRFSFANSNPTDSVFALDLGQLKDVGVIEIFTNRADLTFLLANPTFQASPAKRKIELLHQQGLLWNHVLREILGPGPKVQVLLRRVEQDHLQGRIYKVALQIRTSDRYFHSRRPKRDRRTREGLIPCYVVQVVQHWGAIPAEQRARDYPDGIRVFITADDPAVVAQVQQLLAAASLPWFDTSGYAGDPVHTRMRGDQTRTMLDWWLFTRMDWVIATRSGYSETALRYSCGGVTIHCPFPREYPPGTENCQMFRSLPAPGLCQPSDLDLKPFRCH